MLPERYVPMLMNDVLKILNRSPDILEEKMQGKIFSIINVLRTAAATPIIARNITIIQIHRSLFPGVLFILII